MNGLFAWNFKAAFAGKWIEFQDFREYTSGDDAKYIDWLTSSREGTVVMRRYREEKQGDILCVLDMTESLYFEWNEVKMEVLNEVLELVSTASIGSGESFGGIIIWDDSSEFIPAQKSMLALYKLRKYKEVPPRSIKSVWTLKNLTKYNLKRSIVFVISDSLHIDEQSFRLAAIKHDIVYVHISSYFENTLEWKWMSHLRGRSKSLAIDLDDENIKKTYKAERENQLKNFSRRLKQLGVDSIFLDEKKSVFAEFLYLMKRRER